MSCACSMRSEAVARSPLPRLSSELGGSRIRRSQSMVRRCWGEAVARLSERYRSRCGFVPIRGPPCRSAIVGRQAGHLSGEPCALVAKIAQGDLHGGELPPQNGLALLEAKVPLLDLAREVARQVFLALDRLRDQSRRAVAGQLHQRSEEHTSELQSLMRISYAVFCLKKKKNT